MIDRRQQDTTIRLTIEGDGSAIAVLTRDDAPSGAVRTERVDRSRYVDYDSDERPIRVEFLSTRHGVNVAALPRADELARLFEARDIRVYCIENYARTRGEERDGRWLSPERNALDRLARSRGLARWVAFLTSGEGSFFPNGIEETSGYILDDRGRAFRFWTGWDPDREEETLTEWEEADVSLDMQRSTEYQRARAAVDLPTAPDADGQVRELSEIAEAPDNIDVPAE